MRAARALLAICGALWAAALSYGQPGTTLPVSVGLTGCGPAADATSPSASSDGRYVAYQSASPDLVLGDHNNDLDVFVTDTLTRTTTLVSVSVLGGAANGASTEPSISADGRFVAFRSEATDLISGDTNSSSDVFVRDLVLEITWRISIDTSGVQGNDASLEPSISSDGRYVAFSSDAWNLVSGDTNGARDVFVRDRVAGTTIRVSVSSSGAQATALSGQPSISANGRYVAFASEGSNLVSGDTNGVRDVFARDRVAGTTRRVSVSSFGDQANGPSGEPAISPDGFLVAYESDAWNLAPNDFNFRTDVFRSAAAWPYTDRASVDWTGAEFQDRDARLPAVADTGVVTFVLLDLYVDDPDGFSESAEHMRYDPTLGYSSPLDFPVSADWNQRLTREVLRASPYANGSGVAYSRRGSFDVPGASPAWNIVLRQGSSRALGSLSSVPSGLLLGNSDTSAYSSAVAASGRLVAFDSRASNLVPGDSNGNSDAFVRDLVTGTTERVSVSSSGAQASGGSASVSASQDGRLVAFTSWASNLVPGDTNGTSDVFVRDRAAGATVLASVSTSGHQANDWSGYWYTSLSADGRYVAFASAASNLVPGDTNGHVDVFVRDLVEGVTVRASVSASGEQGNATSDWPMMSADGRFVVFASDASNLVEGDTNGVTDVFVRDLLSGETSRVSVSSSATQANGRSGLGFIGDRPAMSADGRYVAFTSRASNLVAGDTNGWGDVFVRDRVAGTTERVSVSSGGLQGNDFSSAPTLSADGRFVAFSSWASNLVPGDTNGATDVFVRDRVAGTTTRVSVDSAGDQGDGTSSYPSISADGRHVAFASSSSNFSSLVKAPRLWDLFIRELGSAGSTVSGTVTLAGFIGPRALPEVTFELVPIGGGATVTIGPVALGAGGTYSFATSATGTFDLYAKASTFLRRKYAGTIALAGMPVSGIDLVLANGDVDGSNRVDLDDFLILAAQYELTPPTDLRADLNGDEAVNLDDFLILAGNYEMEGD